MSPLRSRFCKAVGSLIKGSVSIDIVPPFRAERGLFLFDSVSFARALNGCRCLFRLIPT